MVLTYREASYGQKAIMGGKFVLIQPYSGEEGSGYGEGDGTVTGEKLSGRVRWVNHPHRRSDGAILPDAHGVIVTEDGAAVLFSLQGRTFFEGDLGKQLLTVVFEAEDARYAWLNASLCVLEGLISLETAGMRGRVYRCVHELV
jgi:hypothetical protein